MNQLQLHTERLKLRLIQMSDADAIHALPETDEYNTLGIPKDKEETVEVIAPWIADNQQDEITNYTFAIEHVPGNQFLGLVVLKLGNRKHRK